MTFEEKYINKIINVDSLTVMREMPDNSVDLVVTSPPYNLKTRFFFPSVTQLKRTL